MSEKWTVQTLGESCDIFNGNSIPAKIKKEKYLFDQKGLTYIGTKDVGFDHQIIYDTGVIIPPSDYGDFRLAPAKCTLICAEGGSAGRKLGFTDQEVFFGNKLYAIVPRSDLIDKYVFYYCQSEFFKKQFFSLMSGIIGGVNQKKFKSIKIPVPPLKEQQRIVSILDEASNNIAVKLIQVEHKLNNAIQIFQSILDSIIAERGIDWVDMELGQYARFRNGMNFSKGSNGEEIKIVGVGDFQQRFWVPNELLGSKKIDGNLREIDQLAEGDILAVRSNGNRNLIGRCILAGPISEKISHSGFTIRIRVDSKTITPRYLCYFMKSSKAKDMLIKGGTGSQISNLNQELLSRIIVPTPPLSIQDSIVQRLDDLSAKIVKLENLIHNESATLLELKQSILQEAFNGNLRITKGLAGQS